MDPLLIVTQLALSALGVLGVATGAPEAWEEHAGRAVLGIMLTLVVARLSPRTVVRLSPWAYVGVLLLLALVIPFGISPAGSESNRWLPIGGFALQPSELMKVTVVAYLSAFFYNHLGDWQIWRPMVVIGLAAGAIVMEPDVSTALFVFALAFAIMLAAGTTLTRLLSITIAAALIAAVFAGPYLGQYVYIKDRITGFYDLWGDQEQAQTLSYQALQARRTVARSGLFGIGSGRPVSVPDADTDMVAISVAQALGLIGVMSLCILYGLIAIRGVQIASSLSGPGSLLAAGAATYICGQAALNLLVASGLLPVTGVPLPFVSYGLNSLVSVAVAMGFIHSAYRQSRREGAVL